MHAGEEDRITTARLVSRLRESGGKEGVYFVVRFPTRWRLYAFAWEDFGNLWHGDAWRRYVVGDLAEAWAARLQTSVQALSHELAPWWKGFRRGRVQRVGIQEYTIFHADDLADTGVTRERVLNAFELANRKITWSLDPQEQENPEHRAALARLLHLAPSSP